MQNRERVRQEGIRFTKFLVVGLIGAVVDFGIMNACSQLLNLSLTISGSISFFCAVISNFFWNRYWTYPDSRSRSVPHQLGMFFVVNLIGIFIRIPILHYLEPLFTKVFQRYPLFDIDTNILANNVTLAIAVLFVLLWNFFINRYWTYNDID
jgi:putative flippase GtrA